MGMNGENMLDKMEIFFDASRAVPPSNYALEAFTPYKETYWCTPKFSHSLSEKAASETAKLWEPIFELVQASSTSSVITGDFRQLFEKLIYHTYFTKALLEGKTHFFVSSKKPFAVLWDQLEKSGCFVFEIPKKEGVYDYGLLEKHLNQKTALVVADWAEPFSGLMQPIEELAFLCEKKEVDLYVNATHVVGKMLLLMEELPITFLQFDAAFLQSPIAISLFFTKGKHPFAKDFEDRYIPLSHLSVFSACARQALLQLDQFSLEMARIKSEFERKLVEALPSCEKVCLSSYNLPHVSLFYFPKILTKTLAYFLNEKKVYIAEELPSLKELLAESKWAEKFPFIVSFSFSKNTTLKEIETAISRICEQVKTLQKLTEDL